MAIRTLLRALVLPTLACFATLTIGVTAVQVADGEWSVTPLATVVTVGCGAFILSVVACCAPILSLLKLVGHTPTPVVSAALGSALTVVSVNVVVFIVLSDNRDQWMSILYSLRHLDMVALWVAPFVIPGALFGASWSQTSRTAQT